MSNLTKIDFQKYEDGVVRIEFYFDNRETPKLLYASERDDAKIFLRELTRFMTTIIVDCF